jgi:hypothetical protein
MTAVAGLDPAVQPDELVAGLGMVEAARIPLDESEVPSLVVGVAGRALNLPPMEAALCAHSLR